MVEFTFWRHNTRSVSGGISMVSGLFLIWAQ